MRVCRAHDADDPIEGRIRGHPLPCPEHPAQEPTHTRTHRPVTLTLPDAARARLRELAERRGWPASRVVAELILDAEMPRARRRLD